MTAIKVRALPVFFLVITFFMAGCSGSGDISSEPDDSTSIYPKPVVFDLPEIIERGTLHAIVDNSSTSYFIYKGRPMGYQYDLLVRFTDHIGVDLNVIIVTSIEDAIKKLNNGEGDIIGYNFTVTKERKKYVDFMDYQYTTRQVLVQRKPASWRQMRLHKIEDHLIRNQVELIGKEVHVRAHTSYAERLKNLSNEIGGDIKIVEAYEDKDTETMIRMVANGEIDLTVSDEDIAMVAANYYRNLDIETPISFPQQIAWAVRKNSDQLLEKLNEWWRMEKKEPDIYVLYNKYFKSPRSSLRRVQSDYASISGSKITPYDDILKETSKIIGWDWKLLASQMYQESKFEPSVQSWAGAVGLMQLIPATGKRFGANDLYDPEQNINAGVNYLKNLDNIFKQYVPDSIERVKFVLGSYNVGPGHVTDAINLAEKFGKDPQVWEDNVETYLRLKSQKKYYNDPVVKYGYCRGEEPVKYVQEILSRYRQYKDLINEKVLAS